MTSFKWLQDEAQRRYVRIPQARTLAKYGLTQESWLSILYRQEWKCPICHREEVLWNTDHQHVRGYYKMGAQERAKHVRGILCWHCNKEHAPSNMTAEFARRLASYLEVYENLRDLRKEL